MIRSHVIIPTIYYNNLYLYDIKFFKLLLQLLNRYFWVLGKSVLEMLIVIETLYCILKIQIRNQSILLSWNKVGRGSNYTPFGEAETYSEVCSLPFANISKVGS